MSETNRVNNEPVNIDRIDNGIADLNGDYIYKNKIIKVRDYHKSKAEYMKKYMAQNKENINEQRRQKYAELKRQGRCPKCGVKISKYSEFVICNVCRDSSRK